MNNKLLEYYYRNKLPWRREGEWTEEVVRELYPVGSTVVCFDGSVHVVQGHAPRNNLNRDSTPWLVIVKGTQFHPRNIVPYELLDMFAEVRDEHTSV